MKLPKCQYFFWGLGLMSLIFTCRYLTQSVWLTDVFKICFDNYFLHSQNKIKMYRKGTNTLHVFFSLGTKSKQHTHK